MGQRQADECDDLLMMMLLLLLMMMMVVVVVMAMVMVHGWAGSASEWFLERALCKYSE